MTALLELERLHKAFGDTPVLRGITLAVEEGEVLALLGPSGSGKTTLLRLLAGFEQPDGGSLRLAGSDLTREAPARRGVGMVFQHYALFPHLDVGDNIAFGLHGRRGLAKAEVARRVGEVLALVDLAGYERRRVTALSGGQQQRVAVARALAPAPRLLLLDEPLSNLDPALRERTRRAIQGLLRRLGITTILVTHEQEEAFDLAQRVAVLWAGALQQVGSPEELHERPANRVVATFVGRANLLPGPLVQTRAGWAVTVAPGVTWPGELVAPLGPGAPAELMLRPEALSFAEPGVPGGLVGRVVERRYGGGNSRFRVAAARGPEVELQAPSAAARLDEEVTVAPVGDGPPGRIWEPPAAVAAAGGSAEVLP